MRRVLAAFALACLLALPRVSAGQMGGQLKEALANSTPAERAAIQTDMMKEKLALTAEQAPKVQAINLETAQKMEPVIKGSEGPLVKLRQARELETQKESALEKVLSAEQFQKYLAMREEMKQKLEEKIAHKAAGGTP